jgi:hypothetical protein
MHKSFMRMRELHGTSIALCALDEKTRFKFTLTLAQQTPFTTRVHVVSDKLKRSPIIVSPYQKFVLKKTAAKDEGQG